jgi:hypothetical protein
MKYRVAAVLAVVLAGLAPVALPAPALAQSSLNAYEAARQALLAIWAELPLTVRNATLTEVAAPSYGNYTPRASSEYRVGEQIHVYVEVLGYGWKDNGDGTQSELLDADLNLLNAQGTTVASQPKFLSADIKSRAKLLETFLTLDATLTAFDPGAYKLQYVLHDRAGNKDATFEVPITLVPGEAPSSAAPDVSSSGEAASGASSAAQ